MSYAMGRVDPGIDISHYGAPYRGMFGLDGLGRYVDRPGFHAEYATAGLGMLYRYHGLGAWTGKPSEDPRMVKRYTVVRATWRAEGLPSGGAAEAAQRLHYQGRQLFPGNNVRKIGSTGWISGGRVGYEVVLANPMRAGEIKSKNFQAGLRAARGMGGSVRFVDARTAIPSNAFEDAPASAPTTPEEEPSATPEQEQSADDNPLTRRVAGLPVWGWGLLGLGTLGVIGAVAFSGPRRRPAAVSPNRRRRRRRRRRSSRRRRR